MKIAIAMLLAALPAAALADPGSAPAPETKIPFVRSQGVLDWKPHSDKGLYLRGTDGKWYYAKMMGSCPRLVTANTLGFETNAGGDLDRYSAVRAQGWRCPLESVTRSDAPPPKVKSVE